MRFGKEVDINEISGYQRVNYLKLRIQNLTTVYWIHFFFFLAMNLTFYSWPLWISVVMVVIEDP